MGEGLWVREIAEGWEEEMCGGRKDGIWEG